MKKYIDVPVSNGRIDPSVFNKLAEWAKDKPDDNYLMELPFTAQKDKSVSQHKAYWARCSWMARNICEYSSRGYHEIFMELANFGVYHKLENGSVEFNPISFVKLSSNEVSQLYTIQDQYIHDRNDGLPPEAMIHLPSIEEFKKMRG